MQPLDPRSSLLAPPIGLLGGSFDPIHVGHLQLARDARDRLGLAEVRLVPAAQPWQKGPITEAAQRAHMVALAIAGEPGLVLDMHEIERGGPSYTIDTLRALRAQVGPAQPLVLIIGADQMARLDTWREWQALTDYAHIAVAHRDGTPAALSPPLQAFRRAHHAPIGALRQRPQGALVDLPMTPVDASATEIRALLSEPPSPARDARLAALVPPPVLLYIRQQGLYAPHAQLAPREKEKPKSMDLQKLQRTVVDALEDVKAQDIKVFNTLGQSDMFDRVIVASATSNRQTRALAWSVVEKVKQAGGQVVSVEGTDPGEWVLVDLGDIVVHIMQPAIREYYGLEEMWGAKPVKVKLASEMRGNRPDREEPPAAAAAKAAPTRKPGAAAATSAAAAKTAGAAPARRATKGTRTAAKKSAAKKSAAKKAAPKKSAATKATAKKPAAKPSTRKPSTRAASPRAATKPAAAKATPKAGTQPTKKGAAARRSQPLTTPKATAKRAAPARAAGARKAPAARKSSAAKTAAAPKKRVAEKRVTAGRVAAKRSRTRA
jgi:nicotinate (nicotinamide) nucleotide adenylyltransferase/ribosome silencing factor RsfS/YbeB/iojap